MDLNCINCINLPEIQINDCWLKNCCESCNKIHKMTFDEYSFLPLESSPNVPQISPSPITDQVSEKITAIENYDNSNISIRQCQNNSDFGESSADETNEILKHNIANVQKIEVNRNCRIRKQNPQRKIKTTDDNKYFKHLNLNSQSLDSCDNLLCTSVTNKFIPAKLEVEPIVEIIKRNKSNGQKLNTNIKTEINSNTSLCHTNEKTENRAKVLNCNTILSQQINDKSNQMDNNGKSIKTTIIEIHTEEEPFMRRCFTDADEELSKNMDIDFLYEYNEDLQACCEISLNETTDDLFKIPTEPLKLDDVSNFRNKLTQSIDKDIYKTCHIFNILNNRQNCIDINQETLNNDFNEIFDSMTTSNKMTKLYKLTKPYECDICQRSFSSRLIIEKHFMRKHSTSSIKSCRLCCKEFGSAKQLRRHWRTHEEGPFKCKICEKELSGLTGLEMHMRTHTGERPFKCKICYRSFAQTSSLSCHVRTHTGEKPYQCAICKKSFSQSSSLAAHRFVHTGQKPHACEYCSKTFAIRPQLRKHLQSRHSATKPYKCDECGKSYRQKLSLRYHMQQHRRENILYCEYCPKTFVRPICLQLHIKRMHTNCRDNGLVKVTLCSTRKPTAIKSHLQFENNFQLNRLHALGASQELSSNDLRGNVNGFKNNIKKNLSISLQTINTAKCNNVTITTPLQQTKEQVYSFNLTANINNSPFTCDMCGQTFSQFKQIKRHINNHRRLLKSFCNICQRQFTQRGSLLRHMCIHTNERPYKCEICAKTFAHITYLTNHRFIHDPVKPYPCSICVKSFINSSSLQNHLLRHANIKPYECSLCHKKYMNKQSLGYHIQRHTGENLLQCQFCKKQFVRANYLAKHMRRHNVNDNLGMYKYKNLITKAVA